MRTVGIVIGLLCAQFCVAVVPADAQDASRLLVIAPAVWEGELKPYLDLRKAQLDTQFVAVEDALASEEGADAPERLKRYLYAQWKGNGLGYVLLVGDADTLPVRFMALDRNTEPAFNYAFYASDLYYADLARDDGSFDDWNGQKDGFHARYFGEVRGEHHKDSPINYDQVSYVPELAVGRWPVSTVEDLRAIIAKTRQWEERVRQSAPRALFIHQKGWIDARERLGKTADTLAGTGWNVARQFYADDSKDPSPGSVCGAIVDGVDVVIHAGHGSNETWDGCMGARERDNLAVARPAVFLSVGCGTAHFCAEAPYDAYLDADGIPRRGTNGGEVFTAEPPPPASLQPGRYNSTGLGEKLVRMPGGGAVAYIGCNTGSQPCALSLVDGFVQGAAAQNGGRLGDAWKAALAHYWEAEGLAEIVPTDSWYPASIFFQGMKFMLFGDPALSLPSG